MSEAVSKRVKWRRCGLIKSGRLREESEDPADEGKEGGGRGGGHSRKGRVEEITTPVAFDQPRNLPEIFSPLGKGEMKTGQIEERVERPRITAAGERELDIEIGHLKQAPENYRFLAKLKDLSSARDHVSPLRRT
jgi:hypothetical protein